MEFNELLSFLSGPYVLVILFILMFLAGLGSPLNGDLIMVFMGTMSGLGKISALSVIIVAYAGILLGDSSMFLLGRKFGFKLLKFWPFNKIFKKSKVYRINKFIKKQGPLVILMARFVPGTRTLTIFSSGVFKMSFLRFFPMNALGLGLLVPVLVLFGKYFVSSIAQAKENLIYLSLTLMIVVAFTYFSSKKIFDIQN